MIRNTNRSDRRVLTSPVVHPCDNIALSTLLPSLITLSNAISNFQHSSFPCNKRNARIAIRLTRLLQPFLHEIRDHHSGLADPATLSLSELHLTFQKLLFLLEDLTRKGAKLYMLMESDRVATQFRVISRSVATALDVFPFGSVEISEETKEHVLLLNEQARRARLEFEQEDKRVVVSVVSGLTRFENRVPPGEGDLKWVLEYIGVKKWSECNKEVKFLEGEIGFECLKNEEKGKMVFLSSLMGFMSYCRCVVMEDVDCEESNKKINVRESSVESEVSLSLTFLNSDDFRCPISLELMSDPVTIETGHTYDRSSILKWFSSGNLMCPKTGKRLSSTEMVPNLVLRRLIQQHCYTNGISIPFVDSSHRNRKITRTEEPGSVAAEGAMRMLASFLNGMIENGSGEEKNRGAFEIRLLSKTSIFSRSCLVEAGLAPLLLKLLSSSDSLTQENAAAALLNLSKCAKSRSVMVEKWGLELIIDVLRKGLKIEASQHVAAVLFYLSAEYGNLIGEEPEAIPSLIRLIKDGSYRSKKNGLVAIFGLLKHPENHRRVLEGGAISSLVDILKGCEKEDLITDSLAILATLAERSEGMLAILHGEALHVAVEILSCSTSRVGKEHCVALLLSLSLHGGEDVVAYLVKRTSLMGSLYSMAFSIFKHVLSLFLLCIFLQEPTNALRKTYIVYMGGHSHGPDPLPSDLETATNSHHDLLASYLGSHEKAKEAIIYSYNKYINGFAALLEEEEASQIAKNPNVVSIFLSKERKLFTTRSWDFLGLEKNGKVTANSAWRKARYGENIIIANIDTGVWPEHPSFSDKGYGPIPSKWRGKGVCQIDSFNGTKKYLCNRKLIGARIFLKSREAGGGKVDQTLRSGRDLVGHGTHTLSTAGGNFVPGANVEGNGNGTAKGGSPRARVVAYKACWNKLDEGGCYDADILEAFDHAIYDGVDVISASLGGSNPYPEALFTDGISIGAFHAVARNIVVVCSAGNDGPAPLSVTNVAPWSFTVAASTMDRDFRSRISLSNNQSIIGASLNRGLPSSSPSKKFYPVIYSVDARLPSVSIDDARLCKPGTLDPTKVKGKILVCLRGNKLTSASEGEQGKLAGAVAVLVQNDDPSDNLLLAENHVLPAASISGTGSHNIKNGTGNNGNNKEILAYLSAAETYIGVKPAPIIAGFSSRGPSSVQPLILKPDITAPGVNVIAAFTQGAGPSNLPSDRRRSLFNVQQGTSMSCPHVAGIAGLLKTYHPTWSPAAIKSAIMTTATTLDNTNQPIRNAFHKVATPFEYGAGHIQPNLAIDPGLVYDLRTTDYLNFLCASGYNQALLNLFAKLKFPYTCPKSYRIEDFNYPSITVRHPGSKTISVTRTVTNVGPPSTYVVNTHGPKGIKVLVQPSSLTFKRTGEKKKFQVILQPIGARRGLFGNLSWTDGKHRVTSPITILP